ncbi:MAG TPA: PAS domain S-box protein [Bdellovibrionales bacterium]|nr:PAS domain S-box protein [Bdellovibrionales bacterium]
MREICLFSIHNLISDPPFAQIDLVCCRNVMIYLGPHLQKKLFPVFHYALKVNGFLFLGSSETFTSHKELFKPVSNKFRIGQRKTTALKLPPIATSVQSYLTHFQQNEKVSEADIGLIAQRIALDEMPLRYAVVNEEGQIISSSSGINKYMQFPDGAFANNLIKLVNPGIRAAMRKAFSAARKEKRRITNDTCTIHVEGGIERTLVIVQPMPQLGEHSELYWIAFQSLGKARAGLPMADAEDDSDQAETLDQLERELTAVRQELDKSVQDLEASNEELKSSNEELLSMNEELQSANEELEASKEEVQNSNDALQKANTDLENLLSSTEIATLFLDDEYKIRGFTPAIRDVYNVKTADIGRSLFDLSSHSKDMPAFPELNAGSLEQGEEVELTLPDGRSLLRRVLPYRTHEQKSEGVVATFIDVTELKKSQNRFFRLANSVPLIIWTTNTDGSIDFYNDRWFEFTGQDRKSGQSWSSFVHPEDVEKAKAEWVRSAKTGETYNVEYRLKRHDGKYFWHQASAKPYRDKSGDIVNWFGTCVDIHKRREFVDAISISESHFRTLVDNSPAIMWTTDKEAKCTYLSKQWYETTGGTPERDLGFGWVESCHPDDKEAAGKAFFSAVEARGRISIRYRLRQKDGSYRWSVDSGMPLISESGEFMGYIGTVIDIHDQVQSERAILELTERFERSARATKLGVWYCDLPFDELIWNQEVKRHFFMKPEQRVTLQDFYAHIVPEDRERAENAIATAIADRAPYDIIYRTADPENPERVNHIRAIGWTDYDSRNNPIRFDGITLDVTELVKALELSERAKLEIENERTNFRRLFQQTPEMVCILSGPEHRFEFVNEAHIRALGFDARGLTVREAQPESVQVHGILDDVYRTGKTAELSEIPVTIGDSLRYFNLTYAARRDTNGNINGIMILGIEVTENILSRAGLRRQGQALELALTDAPMSAVLDMLCRAVEEQLGPDLIASILIADAKAERLLHGAAPGLPQPYNETINGLQIGAAMGSCGTAAFLKKPVFVTDIATDPLWRDFKDLAQRFGLKSCWSKPILNSHGKLLGTFAVYSRQVRVPSEREKGVLKVASQSTALILERKAEMEERVISAKAAERAREELHSFFMQAPSPMVILTGPEHRFTLANPLYEKYIGRKVIGKTIREAFADQNVELYEKRLDEVYRTGVPYVGHALPLLLKETDGSLRNAFIDVSYTPFRDQEGNIRGILTFIRDVTEQKSAEEALKSASAASEKASLAKTAFLANMSHEIRTPLAAILGFSELLKQKIGDDPQVDDFVDRILRNSNQLSRLIDELLDLSKIEADKIDLEITPVEIDALLEDVRSTMVLRAAEKSLSLEFEWATEKPAEFCTDRLRLTQILINLVGNAVKFTERGFVRVELGHYGDELRVRISDSGIGLAPDQQHRIFEPFMQADPSVKRKYGGTGLGLALSSKMAKLLGGELTLEKSELGKGTSFILTVKSQKAQDHSQIKASPKTSDPIDAHTLKGCRILVVDDSEDNRFIVGMALSAAGAMVREAINGAEALELAAAESVDLILMDIQMPVMDGYESLTKLQECGFEKPVIALTANAFKEERDRCIAAGFSGYITKPISRATLIRNVADLLAAADR